MFTNLKTTIKELAYSAVNFAETSLSSAEGQAKKNLAIQYIVERIPVVEPFRKIIILILTKFIDESIEQAVRYMKEIKNKEQKL